MHLRLAISLSESRRHVLLKSTETIKRQVEFRFSIRHAILWYLVPSVARRRRSLRSCSSNPRVWPTVSTYSDKSTGSLHEHNNWQKTGNRKKKEELISLGRRRQKRLSVSLDRTKDNNHTHSAERGKKKRTKKRMLLLHQLTQFKFIKALPYCVVTQLDLINWLETICPLVILCLFHCSIVFFCCCCCCCRLI